MAVELPQVYLVTIDAVSDWAIQEALRRTRDQATFGGWTHFFDRAAESLEEVQRTMWWTAWKEARHCSHILFIQYDGWVLNGNLWQDSWLQYDYIGAPWPWISNPGEQVGNGGFSLRSARLMKFLAEHAREFPLRTPEDVTLCREYRPALEQHGFVWAPLDVARAFSFEREDWRPTFGFHGIFNIPKILPREEWQAWKASANAYIRGKTEWQEVKDL